MTVGLNLRVRQSDEPIDPSGQPSGVRRPTAGFRPLHWQLFVVVRAFIVANSKPPLNRRHMTETERDLLAAVCDRHDDDLPRLVAADYFYEHGDPARADYIHLSIAMSRPRRGCWPTANVQRLKAMTATVGASMLGAIDMPKIGVMFRRGFIEEISLSMSAYWGGNCPRRGCTYGEYDVDGASYRCDGCRGKGWIDSFGERTRCRWPITSIRLVDREPQVMRRVDWFNGPWARYFWWVGNEKMRRNRPHNISHELMKIIRNSEEGTSIGFVNRDVALGALSAAALTRYRNGQIRQSSRRASDAA